MENSTRQTRMGPRTVFDAVHHRNVQGSVLFFPVTHPDYPDWPLTLVVGRRKGGQPWYLLTNEVVQTTADAWNVVLAYARRWHIEMAFRNLKSEMAIQSLRVYDWLISYAGHRTGCHLREVDLPFTRLRIALAKLWLAYPCGFVRPAAWCL